MSLEKFTNQFLVLDGIPLEDNLGRELQLLPF